MPDTRIEIIDGVPHVRQSDIVFDEPIEITRWWPLPSALNQVSDGDMVLGYQGGSYLVKASLAWSGGNQWYSLPQGGQTVATKTYESPIPPPRTKLQTRWKDGQWEKLTKRGWR